MKSSNIEALLGAGLLIGTFIFGASACNSCSAPGPDVKALPSFSNQLVTPLGQKVPGKSVTKLDIDAKRTILITGEINGGNDSTIQKFIGKMEAYIANRANITYDQYKKMSGIELWIDSEDAVNSGFADALVSYVLPANSFVGISTDNVLDKVFSASTIEPAKSILNLSWSVK